MTYTENKNVNIISPETAGDPSDQNNDPYDYGASASDTGMPSVSDDDLAFLAASGDRKAEDLLLHRYKELVRSKARSYFMLGGDQDDVIQEGMIGLVNSIRSFDPSKGASFRTFANMCISRQIITAIKLAGRRKYGPLNEAVSLNSPVSEEDAAKTLADTLIAGSDSDPLSLLIMRELAELILSPDSTCFSSYERTVLRYLSQGLGYKEIAERTGKTPKQADNAVQRVRKKLRELIEWK